MPRRGFPGQDANVPPQKAYHTEASRRRDMKRRALFLAATLGLVAASLSQPTVATDLGLTPGHPTVPATSCEECRANCNLIPMHPDDCIDMYCPECAGTTTPVGVKDGESVTRPEH
jgi:hypothetical protein